MPIIPTDHPLPEVEFDGVGPAVGERFPDLELPNQRGELVDLHERRENRRGLVVIHRSADWWPWCRAQLVELQRTLGEQTEVFVVAISYDPVPNLARFADQHGITYDLLADVGSAEIERLGMLNDTIIEEVGAWGLEYGARHHRVPFPGVFLLDEAGVVIGKKFDRSHRVRASGSVLLADLTGQELAPAVSGTTARPGVGVKAWLDEATFFPAQRLYAHVCIVIEEGLHLYVPPLAEGYVPLQVHIDGRPPLIAEAPELPSGKPFRVEGLDETFSVVEGTVNMKVPFYFSDEATEDATLTVRVEYQACTDSVCFAPEQLRIDLPVGYLPIPRP